MASTNGTVTKTNTENIEGRLAFRSLVYNGPPSYNSGVGDKVLSSWFGGRRIVGLNAGITKSGTYRVEPQCSSIAQMAWNLRWIVLATGLEAAGGVNLSGEQVILTGVGL